MLPFTSQKNSFYVKCIIPKTDTNSLVIGPTNADILIIRLIYVIIPFFLLPLSCCNQITDNQQYFHPSARWLFDKGNYSETNRMQIRAKMRKWIMISLLMTAAVGTWAEENPCSDEMGHKGNAHTVTGNRTGSISGTPWGFERWAAQGGGSQEMTYYDNGTFSASWNRANDFLARVGFRYGDNGPGVDHRTKQYAVYYKFKKTGSASYGYIGVYGWTTSPQVEYYIVEDWFSRPNEAYIGQKFGEITVDGAKYTIHAYLRQQEPSKTGTSTFLQIFSVRQTPRQCGKIDISAHFRKWEELFTGQEVTLRGSKGGGKWQLKFGRPTEVMLMVEAGGNATGTFDCTYFNMVDNDHLSDITPAKTDNETDVWYDLRGNSVISPQKNDLYIRNGQVILTR